MTAPTSAELAPGQHRVQAQFAAHLRDPQRNPAPAGIEDRRLAIYRGLFYRNIEGFVRGAFPVLHGITPAEQWHAMIRDFMACHRCQTPYFLEISQEFIHYLQQVREAQPDDLPFLAELAHYEWVELALDVSEAEPDWQAIDPNGDLLKGRPVVSPVAWSLAYRYPFHRIGVAYQPVEAPPEPSYLLVYRNREDAVKFMETNATSARLLVLLSEDDSLTGEQALRRLATQMQHPDPESIVSFGRQLLSQLQDRGVILGTRRQYPG